MCDDIPEEKRRCIDQPVKVWVCLPVFCQAGEKVHWRNACYSRVEPPEQIDAADLPPGDVVLRDDQGSDPAFMYECRPSCADPTCTECLLFLKCEACAPPAGRPQPGIPPNVFILKQYVTRCGVVGRFLNAQGGDWCFTVRPDGQTYTQAELPADAQFPVGSAVDSTIDCCNCQDGCQGSAQYGYYDCDLDGDVPYFCCCTEFFDGTMSFDYYAKVTLTPVPDYNEFRASGSLVYSHTQAGDTRSVSSFPGSNTAYFADGTLISRSDIDVPVPNPFYCGSREIDLGLFDLAGRMPRCRRVAGPNIVIDSYAFSLTCFAALFSIAWREFRPDGSLAVEGRFTIRYQVNPHGGCGGNCGRSTGALPGAPMLAVPVQPVPPEQWPAWAKTIAAFKGDKDAGVGDTADRIIKMTGPVAIVAKKALELAMKECGCNRRHRDWNVKFGY